jgi:hypothetical protein
MRRLVVAAALGLCVACGGGGGGGDAGGSPIPVEYQGTWVRCWANAGSTWTRSTLVLGTTTWSGTTTNHGNSTCAGAGTVFTTESRSLSYAGAATATRSTGGTVPVAQLDIGEGGGSYYTIAYIDGTATPQRLYLGATDVNHDGSTPARRPVVIQMAGFFLTRQ